MGRQICFYASMNDWLRIINKACDGEWYIIDRKGNELSKERVCERIISYYRDSTYEHLFYLANRRSKLSFFGDYINQIDSEIIEIALNQRNPEAENGFSHGRLWYDKGYYDFNRSEPIYVLKTEELTKKYNSIVREIKKFSVISADKMYYIMSEAYELYKQNLFVPIEHKHKKLFSK